MENYKNYFKDKKITVMGLGLLGGALNDILFLAEAGANLIVTDLKTEKELISSVKALAKYKNIKFTLGGHKLEDFKNRDMVLEPGNVPKNSIYLKEAEKYNTPIFVSESLFAKYADGIKMVGITGTRGKSMTTMLIYEILKKSLKNQVYLGGNIRSTSTLALLKKVKAGDIVVLELDSWALHGMGEIKISPQVGVFTTFMPDHMNYYGGSMKKYFADKANIFKYQKKDDVLVLSEDMEKILKNDYKTFFNKIKSKIIVAKKKEVESFDFIVPGEHQKANLACAVLACQQMVLSIEQIKKSVKSFKGVEGRLQFLRDYKGIKIYNDNNATTPEATIAGIKALASSARQGLAEKTSHRSDPWERNLILICGGADKNLSLENLTKIINLNCKFVSFLPGSGTDKFLSSQKLKVESYKGKNLKEVIKKALEKSNKGDILLFSPAFASFGLFANEYERNDLFVKIIKGLK